MARSLKYLALLAVAAAACAAATGPAWSQAQMTSVGAHGELYTVETGLYGDLFPGQSLADPENPSLALDITTPDGIMARLLVPGTGSDDLEDSASLVFDDRSETLFILWQTKINVIHSKLDLISFHAGSWSPMIEIWGSPFGWKSSPQLAVTRDQFVTETDDGGTRAWARTVVHVIWAEEGAYGPTILYSPIILLDGQFVGNSPVYNLSELADVDHDSFSGPVDPALASAPRIQAGRNGQTVVIGFVESETGRLVTLEAEVLPGEIAHLSERMRRQLIGLGAKVETQPNAYVDELRRQLIGIGRKIDLHPGVAMYAADVVTEELLKDHSGEDINAFAERLRRQLIGIGARMTDRGVDRTLAKTGYTILDLPDADTDDTARGPDLIRVSTVSNRPAPSIGDSAASISLYLAQSGDSVIVAWPEDDRLVYRESQADGWSDQLQIVVGSPGVPTIERAEEMLQQRASNQHSPID